LCSYINNILIVKLYSYYSFTIIIRYEEIIIVGLERIIWNYTIKKLEERIILIFYG